jgi:YbbR domain-containing protein
MGYSVVAQLHHYQQGEQEQGQHHRELRGGAHHRLTRAPELVHNKDHNKKSRMVGADLQKKQHQNLRQLMCYCCVFLLLLHHNLLL